MHVLRHNFVIVPGRGRTRTIHTTFGVIASLMLYATAARAANELRAGSVSVSYSARPEGMSITWDGVRVSLHSELIVTTPPWAPHHYVGPTASAVSSSHVDTSGVASVLSIAHRGANDSFVGKEVLTLHPGGALTQTLSGEYLGADDTALMQWRAAALNPSVIIGRPYRFESADGVVMRGVISVAPQPEDPPIAHGFRWIEFDSRLGTIRIEVEGDRPLVFYDHRASRWSNPESPYFWFGDLGTRLAPGSPVLYRVTYRLIPADCAKATAPTKRGVVPVQAHDDAQCQDVDRVSTLVPTPKHAVRIAGNAIFPVQPATSRVVNRPWRLAEHELLRHWKALGAAVPKPMDTSPVLDFQLAESANELPSEGYRLDVTPDRVEIVAADTAGFLHAVQTLKQLSWRNREGAIEVAGATIRDWPSLPFRGVHIFTGGQGPELHERLIRDVYAATKLNQLVLEAEYVHWDAFPEIRHPRFGMSKADVRRVLAVSRELGIAVTPLVQSLGHCQWMFENNQHLDLAEDPEAKWAYCVTNPRTYDFIFTVYTEALELFQPRMLHIGHDEYTDRGRVPFRPESANYTVEELFMMDTLKLHAWLRERGVRVMMWGDMLLAKGEAPDACHARSKESAAMLRAQLPDDIVIADWHYAAGPPEDFTSLEVFHDDGHATVASTWYRPGNIVGFAQAAHQQEGLGLLQTTWAGYSLDVESFTREMRQYLAHVLAAEVAWNADRAITMDLLSAGEAFFNLMGTTALASAARAGWTGDLASIANVSLSADTADGWLGLGPEHDLSTMPTGDVRLRGVRFRVAPKTAPNAVVLAGRLAAQCGALERVAMEIDAPAEALVLLLTSEFPCESGTRVARVDCTFADGGSMRHELVYGENLFAYTDLTPAAKAPVMWRGKTQSGQDVAVRSAVVPLGGQRRLKSIALSSAGSPASLVLIGLTGLSDAD